MPVRVRFRMNKLTGEVEELLVDDQDRTLPESEHERIAAEVGRAIARNPALTEVRGAVPPPEPGPAEDEPAERDREPNAAPERLGAGQGQAGEGEG